MKSPMSNNYPSELKYTNDHEWTLVEDDQVTVGITAHAQNALGDIVFLELPEEGAIYSKGDAFGVIESVKAVSDLYSPVTGKVIEVHSALIEDPSMINTDPHDGAWLVKLELTDPSSLEDLMDSDEYYDYVESLD